MTNLRKDLRKNCMKRVEKDTKRGTFSSFILGPLFPSNRCKVEWLPFSDCEAFLPDHESPQTQRIHTEEHRSFSQQHLTKTLCHPSVLLNMTAAGIGDRIKALGVGVNWYISENGSRRLHKNTASCSRSKQSQTLTGGCFHRNPVTENVLLPSSTSVFSSRFFI